MDRLLVVFVGRSPEKGQPPGVCYRIKDGGKSATVRHAIPQSGLVYGAPK